MRKRNFFSAEIATNKIKVILGCYNNKEFRVLDYKEIDLYTKSIIDGEIIDLNKIKEILRINKIISNNVIFTLESSKVLRCEYIYPSHNTKNLKKMIIYEINKKRKKYENKYIYNYKLINKFVDENNIKKTRIILYSFPTDIASNYYNLAKKLLLKPIALDINSNCLTKLISNSMFKEDFINKYKDIAILELNKENAIINIYTDKNWRFSKAIKVDSSKIQCLAEEIKMVYKYYSSLHKLNKIDAMYLYGDTVNLNEIKNKINKCFVQTHIISRQDLQIKINVDNEEINVLNFLNTLGALIRN